MNGKRILLVGALLALFSASHSATAELMGRSEYDSYVVIMRADPVIAYSGEMRRYQATRPGKGRKVDPGSAHVRKYQRFLRDSHDAALRGAGVASGQKTHDYTVALNGFAARMSYDQAAQVAKQKGVAMVLPDELRQPMTDNTTQFLGLDAPGGPQAKGFDGEGIVIGVIDSGIWPEHPSFIDDGSYPALPQFAGLPCDFGNTAQNAADAAFTCNNKLLGARQVVPTYRSIIGAEGDEFDSARDDSGHGTHTASTSAGAAGTQAILFDRDFGNVNGVAPRARVIAYKALGKLGGFSSDLAEAIDTAVADGVDVINYSIGSGSFAVAPDDVAFLFAANAGVFVATSNGNSGPAPATIGSPASVPWVTSVGASTQDRTFQGSAVTGDGLEVFGASITEGTDMLPLVDSVAAGSELCLPGELDLSVVEGNIVLCRRGSIARVAKSDAVLQAGGAGMILYNESDGDSQNTDGHAVPSVHISNTDGLAVKAYIAAAGSPTARIEAGVSTVIDAPWMGGFSSRGPNLLSGDIIKPDITAPGVNILAGHSPVNYEAGPQGELFQIISGTSMSSPHVAGLFALIKQAHPDWTPAMARSALMTTAYQDVKKEDGETEADPFDMGAGHVNPGLKANKNSIFEPGLAFDAGLFEYAGYTCGAELGVFTAGTCAFLESIDIPSDPSDLNLPSIGIADLAGAQTVRRTVTSVAKEKGWHTYRPVIDAPPGFTVEVSPSTLNLRSGMTASYDVTITNVSAPVGEWRFGALTWVAQGRLYQVRSPIAVKAALFVAAEEAVGSGVSGSASFDVTFGYDGSYLPAAHGLEPATVFSDTVAQDPDQTFDPDDGFSNQHLIQVNGAALLRLRLPPDAATADADLDLFLFDPQGDLVAQSTNGGTDEAIDVQLPASGTWTLYVHGWLAPGFTSYDLSSWVVSSTPGGNLQISEAPALATKGSTETVEVSWTGAAAGEWHVGVVSHTGDAGLMGLTVIDVDNR